MEPVVVRVEDVTKTYRRGDETIVAVDRAGVALHERQFVGLVGRSGSGKTTLLNLVAGWEKPDSGTITHSGASSPSRVPTWKDLAVVPQKLGLMDELTIRENVEYPARLTRVLRDVDWLVDELVESLGLRELQDRYPKQVSVGEQQRAAVARALVLSPRLLLADEPSGHQDREWRNRLFGALREAVAAGTSCLAASHDEGLVSFLDRTLVMQDGRLSERSA